MKRVFLLVFLASAVLAAKPIQLRQVDQQIIHYMYDARWHQADSLLNAEIKSQPHYPKYYYLKMQFYFYTRYFNNNALNQDSLRNMVLSYAERTIESARYQEFTPEIKLYVGSAYGYKCRIYAARGQFWNAYWAARQSRVYLQEALEENPDLHDARIELAAIEYFTASRLSPLMTRLAGLAGLGGDRETAISQFKAAAEKGAYSREEAKFILAMLYRYFENDYQQAFNYNSYLSARYPNNNFFYSQYKQTQFILLIDEKGIGFLQSNPDSLRQEFAVTNANVLNALGYTYLAQQNYERAEAVFQTNISLFPAVANCYDSMGECYLTMGDEGNAEKYYSLAFEKLATDSTINDEFRERLKTGIEEVLARLREN